MTKAKPWTIKWRTKNGIRESMIAGGWHRPANVALWKREYHRRYMQLYCEEFPNAKSEIQKKYYRRNRKRLLAYKRAYAIKHKERIAKYNLAWQRKRSAEKRAALFNS